MLIGWRCPTHGRIDARDAVNLLGVAYCPREDCTSAVKPVREDTKTTQQGWNRGGRTYRTKRTNRIAAAALDALKGTDHPLSAEDIRDTVQRFTRLKLTAQAVGRALGDLARRNLAHIENGLWERTSAAARKGFTTDRSFSNTETPRSVKRPNGRPPLPRSRAIVRMLSFRVRDSDIEAFRQSAKDAGLSVSEWARVNLLKASAQRDTDRKDKPWMAP